MWGSIQWGGYHSFGISCLIPAMLHGISLGDGRYISTRGKMPLFGIFSEFHTIVWTRCQLSEGGCAYSLTVHEKGFSKSHWVAWGGGSCCDCWGVAAWMWTRPIP